MKAFVPQKYFYIKAARVAIYDNRVVKSTGCLKYQFLPNVKNCLCDRIDQRNKSI